MAENKLSDEVLDQLAKKMASSKELPKFLVLAIVPEESSDEDLNYKQIGQADNLEEALDILEGTKGLKSIDAETPMSLICLGFDDLAVAPIMELYADDEESAEEIEVEDIDEEEEEQEESGWENEDYLNEKIRDKDFWREALSQLSEDDPELLGELADHFGVEK